jgi:hypothetical protein
VQQRVQTQLVSTTIQSLSVVMTPPSHENINQSGTKSYQNHHSNQPSVIDDEFSTMIINEQQQQFEKQLPLNGIVENTKAILFKDLNAILTSDNRKCLLTNLISEQPNDLFRFPRLNSQLTNSLNKYKSVRLATTLSTVQTKNKLKWRYVTKLFFILFFKDKL